MNGAQPGEARLCAASLRAPLPAPTSTRPAHPDPCCQGAETRRPLRTQASTTHKVRGGRVRRAPGCGVHGGVSRELVGGEWHRAPRGQGWTGGCALAGRVFGSAKRTCSLRPEGNSRAGASAPGTELSVAGSSGSRGSDPGTRTGRRGVSCWGGRSVGDRLYPVALGKGPRSVLAEASHGVASALVRFHPSLSPFHRRSDYRF